MNSQIICTTIFIKLFLQDKKLERFQNQQKYILQQKNVVAGKNLPYVERSLQNHVWNNQQENYQDEDVALHFSTQFGNCTLRSITKLQLFQAKCIISKYLSIATGIF